jgi:S1-C subfamily serine protease
MLKAEKGFMTAYRRAVRRVERGLTIGGVVAVVGAAALVLMLAEHGSFHRFGRSGTSADIPSLTIGDSNDKLPVVTSVRSGGAAARAGIRVGDEIESVDGRSVHTVAALRTVMQALDGKGPLALHIRRRDAIWTIVIGRSETAAGARAATGATNGAENPAD